MRYIEIVPIEHIDFKCDFWAGTGRIRRSFKRGIYICRPTTKVRISRIEPLVFGFSVFERALPNSSPKSYGKTLFLLLVDERGKVDDSLAIQL